MPGVTKIDPRRIISRFGRRGIEFSRGIFSIPSLMSKVFLSVRHFRRGSHDLDK